MRGGRRAALACSLLVATVAATEVQLPPAPYWNGASRALLLPADHPWATPFEQSGQTRTPDYEATVAWLRRLVDAAPELEMISIGESAEGRDIWLVIASRDGAKTPDALRARGLPILFVQAGIHAGEIDGKDACMMLLRDLTVVGTKRALLEQASLLFVPILNVDGHERVSPYGRINQRGPAETGWRSNARNLNLNRDYAKLDTLEMRAIVRALATWQPDLYFDIHVTDGIDYQYDITFGWNGKQGWSPTIARWLDERLGPALQRDLEAQGHISGPLVFAANERDLSEGLKQTIDPPRYSTGYGDARHLATVLVENHSLKPYEQRVLGTYVLLESALATLGREQAGLRRATERDRTTRKAEVVLEWKASTDLPPWRIPFKGVRSELVDSVVAGRPVVRWTGEPVTTEVSLVTHDTPRVRVERPSHYYIPVAWRDIADRLAWHGIEIERLSQPQTVNVEMYRLPDAKSEVQPGAAPDAPPWFEGHARVDPGEPVIETRTLALPAGSYRVPTDQPLGDLAVLLLEPQSPDSFFRWGFMLEVLTRSEYAEEYVMEPLARQMLETDPGLADEFRATLLADPELAADPKRRLDWFYRRTPWYENTDRLYPIARSIGP
jgi:murein tripeptide amidase MpaA